MKILLLADTEDPALWDYFSPDRVKGYDLILAAGDLKAEYLTFLVTMSNLPVFYVHGNHNAAYDHYPPEGCECIDDRLVTYRGLRILGLGGSARYSREPYQYTEREMRRRIARLRFAVWKARGVDIVLTHCPPKGIRSVSADARPVETESACARACAYDLRQHQARAPVRRNAHHQRISALHAGNRHGQVRTQRGFLLPIP